MLLKHCWAWTLFHQDSNTQVSRIQPMHPVLQQSVLRRDFILGYCTASKAMKIKGDSLLVLLFCGSCCFWRASNGAGLAAAVLQTATVRAAVSEVAGGNEQSLWLVRWEKGFPHGELLVIPSEIGGLHGLGLTVWWKQAPLASASSGIEEWGSITWVLTAPHWITGRGFSLSGPSTVIMCDSGTFLYYTRSRC